MTRAAPPIRSIRRRSHPVSPTRSCTSCGDEVRKPADDEIVALLMSGGVAATPWHIPAEAMEEHSGAVISYDELLDFALWLDSHDLVAQGAGSPIHH